MGESKKGAARFCVHGYAAFLLGPQLVQGHCVLQQPAPCTRRPRIASAALGELQQLTLHAGWPCHNRSGPTPAICPTLQPPTPLLLLVLSLQLTLGPRSASASAPSPRLTFSSAVQGCTPCSVSPLLPFLLSYSPPFFWPSGVLLRWVRSLNWGYVLFRGFLVGF